MKKGKSVRAVSELCSIPKSMSGNIWKDREKIETHVFANECPSLMKKTCIVSEATFEKVDQACHLRFLQQRSKEAPISGPPLREKAILLFPQSCPEKAADSFKASGGWLQKFCSKHGIRAMSLQGGSLSADTSSVAGFQRELLSDRNSNDGPRRFWF